MGLRNLILTSVLLIGYISSGQTTAIPDANFEQALIDSGIDSDGILNGQVATSDIETLTALDIAAKGISDLTGIEDFNALTNLYANENSISNVDFSQNLNLKIINLEDNQLSAIDVDMLVDLVTLDITYNHILSLDLSNNPDMVIIRCSQNGMNDLDLPPLPNLSELYCFQNNIDSIDLSSSPSIHKLFCQENNLSYLNLKHGGSSYMEFFSADENPNLTCILVENPTQAQNCCSSEVPNGCVFSTDCNLDVENYQFEGIDFYPNPIEDVFTVELAETANFELLNFYGQTVLNGQFAKGINTADLSFLSSGIYILQIHATNDQKNFIKIVKN